MYLSEGYITSCIFFLGKKILRTIQELSNRIKTRINHKNKLREGKPTALVSQYILLTDVLAYCSEVSVKMMGEEVHMSSH